MYVCLIGGEGGGKTTVHQRLQQENVFPDAVYVRQPGGTELSEIIRDQVLFNKKVKTRPAAWTQFDAFMAARDQLMAEIVWPALAQGQLVLTDRAEDGTFVYQAYVQLGRLDPAWYVEQLRLRGIPLPDLSILFDLEPAVGLARKEGDANANFFDTEKMAFHQKVREGYAVWTKYLNDHGSPAVTIDASQSPDMVYHEVKKIISDHLR